MMRVAAAQYPIERLGSFEAFAAKQRDWIADAVQRGASVVVLPEYLGCELAGWLPTAALATPTALFEAVMPMRDAFLGLFRELARAHRVTIQAGTFITRHGERFRNRASLFGPDGTIVEQDKLALTGFELDLRVLEPGDEPVVFGLAGLPGLDATGSLLETTNTAAHAQPRGAIAICYDSEFPLPVRAQVDAGARVLFVPSCTDTAAGATRVRVGCQARALENQIFVVQSVTAGDASWNPVLDVNTGSAAIYAPIDRGFPADGVLEQAKTGERFAIADLDFAAFDRVRVEGAVANDRDWAAQLRPGVMRAKWVRAR